ncbi:hypothetical protein GCM10020229_38340 [Kitasatospora albolonga]
MDGKVAAITYAREPHPAAGPVPGPASCVVIEAARNLAGLPDANSTEFDAAAKYPVVSTMAEQLAIVDGKGDLGGTMRLGLYPAKLAEGSIVREVYGGEQYVEERHPPPLRGQQRLPRRPREDRPAVLRPLPKGDLVEYVEYPREVHPYLVATQAHPELKSRPTRPHPLFAGLVAAAIKIKTDAE